MNDGFTLGTSKEVVGKKKKQEKKEHEEKLRTYNYKQ